MKQFRIFTNDVGRDAYSCLQIQGGQTAARALNLFLQQSGGLSGSKVLAVADTAAALRLYGPDGQTGKLVGPEVLAAGRKSGEFAGPKVAR